MYLRLVLRTLFRCCSMFFLLATLATLMPSHAAYGQGLEVNGGWDHTSGNNGTDGFALGAAWWFTKRVTAAANYDTSWDTTSLTNFSFTSVGTAVTKAHLQDLLFGPRIFFTTTWTTKHKLTPFAENQYGYSWLNETLRAVNVGSVSASSAHFSWMLGGGVEYLLDPHWSARANLDFLRTHFADAGQSHFRMVLGITYTFGSRGEPK
jgi:hypothetical protein